MSHSAEIAAATTAARAMTDSTLAERLRMLASDQRLGRATRLAVLTEAAARLEGKR